MSNTIAFRVVGLLVLLGSVTVGAEWQAGVAKVEITPTEPIWMAGYASRKHPAEGTIHPLWAKALTIEDERGQKVVILTTDLIGSVRRLSDAVGDRVAKSTGIGRERILINSSHTHSGPVVMGCAEVAHAMDEEQFAKVRSYSAKLEDKLVAVVEESVERMKPAKLSYGVGEAKFAINRRAKRESGFVISPNPKGPVDHSVPVLRVADEQGRMIAALFGYACHNTTTSGYKINGDYAGYAQIAFEKSHPGVTGLFMIGCGGDSNPEPRGELSMAEDHGRELAGAVDRVLGADMAEVGGPLAVAFGRVDLPFVDPPDAAGIKRLEDDGNVYKQRLGKLLAKRMAEKGSLDRSYPCPVQVVRFGDDLSMVAIAGEVVIDYAIRLRREFADDQLWVAGYSHEVFAYLPSERILAEGGYEGGGAMVYFGWHGPFEPGVEELVVGLTKELMERCRGQNR